MMRRREREVMVVEREGVGKGFSESKKVEIGHSLLINMKGRGIDQSWFRVLARYLDHNSLSGLAWESACISEAPLNCHVWILKMRNTSVLVQASRALFILYR